MKQRIRHDSAIIAVQRSNVSNQPSVTELINRNNVVDVVLNTQKPCPQSGRESSSAELLTITTRECSSLESSKCTKGTSSTSTKNSPMKTVTTHVHGFGNDWVNTMTSSLSSSKEKLKYNVDEEAERLKKRNNIDCNNVDEQSTSNGREMKRAKTRKYCTFNEFVDVISIPTRNEYSQRVKARLWSTAVEIHLNATRNTIEFAADGWDWRSVTEDDQMLRCEETGELIHPIHCCEDLQSTSSSEGSDNVPSVS